METTRARHVHVEEYTDAYLAEIGQETLDWILAVELPLFHSYYTVSESTLLLVYYSRGYCMYTIAIGNTRIRQVSGKICSWSKLVFMYGVAFDLICGRYRCKSRCSAAT